MTQVLRSFRVIKPQGLDCTPLKPPKCFFRGSIHFQGSQIALTLVLKIRLQIIMSRLKAGQLKRGGLLSFASLTFASYLFSTKSCCWRRRQTSSSNSRLVIVSAKIFESTLCRPASVEIRFHFRKHHLHGQSFRKPTNRELGVTPSLSVVTPALCRPFPQKFCYEIEGLAWDPD